ncbi:MAG: hypothetical protein B7X06_04030, partial [Verrucomicrobia bacterium 21-51-4]
MPLKDVAHALLEWANIQTLTLIVGVGFACFYRKPFGRGITLMLFSVIFNAVLKALWKIPLPLELHIAGWAFPSGHMQGLTVLAGWIIWEWNHRWAWVAGGCLLAVMGACIIAAGYHDLRDILGGIAAGAFMIACLAELNKRCPWINRHPEFLGLLLAPISLGMLYWLNAYDVTIVHYPCIAAFGGLIILSLGWIISAHFEIPSHWVGKTL